jgi:hypothetical protein
MKTISELVRAHIAATWHMFHTVLVRARLAPLMMPRRSDFR